MAARRTPTITISGSNATLKIALVQRDRHAVGARSGSEFGTDRPLRGAVAAAVFGGNMQSTWQFLRAKSNRLRGTSRGGQRAVGATEMKTCLEFDLNGVRMSPCATDASGVVSSATVMIFEQNNGVVSARYRGGSIVDGYLIGHLHGRSIHFRYVQAQADGRLDAGGIERSN